VHDCTTGTDEISGQITVGAPSPTQRGPFARFTSSPSSPVVGQSVTLDGSPSTDPNGQIVRYEWDADGDGAFERSGAQTTVRFQTPGEHVIRLRVTDDEGLVSAEAGSVTVRPNQPPSAHFTVFPPTPIVDREATLDARGSTDDDAIERYEWDLDGNGSFETDNAREPILRTAFTTLGERFVRLRVTDSGGADAITGRTVVVVPDSLRAHAAQAAPPIVFTARLDGTGTARRRSLIGRGRLRAKLYGDSPAARFLRTRWRTRVSFTRRGATALALARSGRSAVCLRIRLSGRPRRLPSGRLTVLGGRGAGARLRGGAALRFRLERDGSASVLGTLNVRRGKARPLPRRCRTL
jgi:PKD repeat protein